MAEFTNPLNNLRIAAPCPADWNRMAGDDRVRFCGECKLNAYNLSDMSRSEAERLVAQREGRLCVRYFRRTDGTILTDNCPVGLRLIRRRLSRAATAIASLVLSFLGGLGVSAAFAERHIGGGGGVTMGAIAIESEVSSPPRDERAQWMMGAMPINTRDASAPPKPENFSRR